MGSITKVPTYTYTYTYNVLSHVAQHVMASGVVAGHQQSTHSFTLDTGLLLDHPAGADHPYAPQQIKGGDGCLVESW